MNLMIGLGLSFTRSVIYENQFLLLLESIIAVSIQEIRRKWQLVIVKGRSYGYGYP